MKRRRDDNIWVSFLLDNFQWFIVSLLLAFGIWIIAVLQTDPIQQRNYANLIDVDFRTSDEIILADYTPDDGVLVTIRAPRSVWDELRPDQIKVVADLRNVEPGTRSVPLEARLEDDLRGTVVEVVPDEIEVVLQALVTQRIPVAVNVVSEPPSGYSYPAPTCSLVEVTARGPAEQLTDAVATANLNLAEQRNPVTLNVTLVPVNEAGRMLSDVALEPNRIECDVQISQREGVSELSVVPTIRGFPPEGYIYRGYEFSPQTVIVTGRPLAIRGLNGVVPTEPVNITGSISNFEQTVVPVLPEGVRLLPPNQDITVEILIDTIPGSRQYDDIPLQIEGLAPNLQAEIRPPQVTVFAVGPQPLLQDLTRDLLRVTVNASDLSAGTYQREARAGLATEALDANQLTLTVQPSEVSITLVNLNTEVPTVVPTDPPPTPRAR
ncbi:MAG: YbbR-like domain-containing protein [Anaerolineales bacterium]